MQQVGRILGPVAFLDIIAAEPVALRRGDPALDGGAGAQGDADDGQIPPVGKLYGGEPPGIPIHVFGQTDRVLRASLPDGLHQKPFLIVAVAEGDVVILRLFLQHKADLFRVWTVFSHD